VTNVEFLADATAIATADDSPYAADSPNATAGAYDLAARATDSAAHDLTVQGNLPPTVSLTSPGANQSFTAPATVTLTADANDPDGVARVDFFHGATLIGSAVSSPYRVVWNLVPASRYLLTAQATDRLGASQTSAAVPITVNAPASAGLTILYLHADHLGTPRVATDESQTVVWRNPPTTEPFGMALPEEDPDGDGRLTTIHLRFPGQYFDQETQAHYNYFRDHYFPELGRYGQSDPIGLAGGINTYGYAEGSPLNFSDRTGLETGVTIWQPVGFGRSSFGHVSTDINGTTYSFGPGGMSDMPTSSYREANAFRDGMEVKLNLKPQQEKALKACLSWSRDDYSSISNNCGNPVQRCLKVLGIDTGNKILPVSLGNKLLDLDAANGATGYPASQPGSGWSAPWAK
jgi:RHS repeat-associated protein